MKTVSLKNKLMTLIVILASISVIGCGASNAVKGGGIGAGAGAIIGGLIGHASESGYNIYFVKQSKAEIAPALSSKLKQ